MLPQIIDLVNGKQGFEPRLPKSRAIALNPMLVGFVLFWSELCDYPLHPSEII